MATHDEGDECSPLTLWEWAQAACQDSQTIARGNRKRERERERERNTSHLRGVILNDTLGNFSVRSWHATRRVCEEWERRIYTAWTELEAGWQAGRQSGNWRRRHTEAFYQLQRGKESPSYNTAAIFAFFPMSFLHFIWWKRAPLYQCKWLQMHKSQTVLNYLMQHTT